MEIFIAIKQLTSRWWQTLLAIGSIAIGVMILTTALALTNGFTEELIDKILGTSPHITVTPGFMDRIYNYKNIVKLLKISSEIKEILPSIKGQALISDGITTQGTLLYGIDPLLESKGTLWDKYLIKGTLPAQKQGTIVVGVELAKKMGLKIRHQVKLITGIGSMTDLQISGLYQSGLYELDTRIVYINLPQAQKIFDYKQTEVNTISLKLDDVFLASKIADELRLKFPAFNFRSWQDSNKTLLKAMALEKKVIFLVLLFIIIVAMIGIANTLTMIVLEKTSEISILRTMGVTKFNISKLFIIEGLITGLSGVILGCLSGFGLSSFLSFYPLNLPGDVYYIDKIPVNMQFNDFLFVALSALIICTLFSFIPAHRATKFEPVEVLRRHY